jgi:hypothetical protein
LVVSIAAFDISDSNVVAGQVWNGMPSDGDLTTK